MTAIADDQMTFGLLAAPVVAAGLYMVVLGGAALFRPEATKRFLAVFASSARAHFLELFIRLTVGLMLVRLAPEMKFAAAFVVFGWILVGTTVGLFAIPWRMHHRFAKWSVPMATRHMHLFGVASLVAGLALLLAVVWG